MTTLKFGLVAVVLLIGFPSASSAQMWKFWEARKPEFHGPFDCQEVILTASCQAEYDYWFIGEKRWKEDKVIWSNYRSYHGIRTPLAGKHAIRRPEFPLWLGPRCEPEIKLGLEVKSKICEEYDLATRYDWTAHIGGPESRISYTQQTVVFAGEQNKILEFLLKNTHYEGIWTNSSNDKRSLGFLGSHITFSHIGRLYIWGPPGFIVFRDPDNKINLRMTYGFDLYLNNVPIPFTHRSLPTYLTLAKIFTSAELQAIKSGADSGISMVGVSFTLKK